MVSRRPPFRSRGALRVVAEGHFAQYFAPTAGRRDSSPPAPLLLRLRSGGAVVPYFGLGAGLCWTNLQIVEISRRFNFILTGRISACAARWSTCARRGCVEARWYHYSNAGTVPPNLGFNAIEILGRLAFSVGDSGTGALEDARELPGVDVAARDDADGLASRRAVGERDGDGRRARALRHDPLPRREEPHRVGHISGSVATRAPSRSVRASAHIPGWSPPEPMPSTKLARYAIDWGEPAASEAESGAAVSTSQATTRTRGEIALAAAAMPHESPPPPHGTRIVSTSGRSSRISSPIVPLPAITAGIVEGMHEESVEAGIGVLDEHPPPAVERHLDVPRAEALDGVELGAGRGVRDDDGAGHAEAPRREGHTLRHVAGARGVHAAREILRPREGASRCRRRGS